MPSHGIVEVIALAAGLKPFFTGDNAAPFVAVEPSTAPLCALSRNGLGIDDRFSEGDAILILGGGCRLPYVYSMGTLPLVIDLDWVSLGGDPTVVPIGQIIFPNEGQEIDFQGSNVDGIFVPSGGFTVPQLSEQWFLSAILNEDSAATVNQFYAPDSLNGEDLEIDIWLKIQHTQAMSGGS